MEWRVDGELELAGVRVAGGGVLGQGTGERARGLGCGAATGAEACERWGAGALPRAGHGDGEVAAAEHDRGSVVRERGLQHWWSGAKRLRGCRVWRWAAGGGLPAEPAAEEAERERGGRHRLDLFAIL